MDQLRLTLLSIAEALNDVNSTGTIDCENPIIAPDSPTTIISVVSFTAKSLNILLVMVCLFCQVSPPSDVVSSKPPLPIIIPSFEFRNFIRFNPLFVDSEI